MGQTNDNIKDNNNTNNIDAEIQQIYKKINSLKITKEEENRSLSKSYLLLKSIIKEYQQYQTIINKYSSKKPLEHAEKIEFDEINIKMNNLKKWIEMTQESSEKDENFFQIFIKKRSNSKSKKTVNENNNSFNVNDDNKNLDNLNKSYEIKKHKHIQKRGSEYLPIRLNVPNFITKNYNNKNNNDDLNRTVDYTNYKDNKESNIEIYTDKKIEENLGEFYSENKIKFNKKLNKGPPECFRWVSWCICNGLPVNRNNDVYKNYLNKELEQENKERIIRDIQRTFSNNTNEINKKDLRKIETSLYNVLKSFNNLDKEVGYCQGMNMIVGFLLISNNYNERETFYLLVATFSNSFILTNKKFEFSFRGLYSDEFPLLYLFNYIFDQIFEKQIPDLKKHLEQMGITYDLWVGQWFQTLFTIVLPVNWCKRLWDCIFSENIFYVVKFAVVFTNILKKDLLSMDEEIMVIDYFKNLQKFALCPTNEKLEKLGDINNLIIKANKIKLSPEEFIKNFEKKSEMGQNFKDKMEKIENACYNLQLNNNYSLLAKRRHTVLFQEDDLDNIEDQPPLNINQIQNQKENKKNNNLKENKKNFPTIEKKKDLVSSQSQKNIYVNTPNKKFNISDQKNITSHKNLNDNSQHTRINDNILYSNYINNARKKTENIPKPNILNKTCGNIKNEDIIIKKNSNLINRKNQVTQFNNNNNTSNNNINNNNNNKVNSSFSKNSDNPFLKNDKIAPYKKIQPVDCKNNIPQTKNTSHQNINKNKVIANTNLNDVNNTNKSAFTDNPFLKNNVNNKKNIDVPKNNDNQIKIGKLPNDRIGMFQSKNSGPIITGNYGNLNTDEPGNKLMRTPAISIKNNNFKEAYDQVINNNKYNKQFEKKH